MADFFRIQLGVVSRAEGHSAAKRAAYQSCGVVIAYDGERFDFSRKASEHVQTIILTPLDALDWAHSPESLWQRAAAAEKRVDAQEGRIIDFSMPRAVPAELWEDCIGYCYEPFLRMGMVIQVDVHDATASDGGRNINVHGLATLRAIDGDGFAARKNRAWNDHFRERNGRAVREQFAERLTSFCQAHGIDYQGDAQPNSERDRPAPEPRLPKWNFEAWKREGEMPEALAALHDHRKRRRQWEAAQADEIDAALDLAKVETQLRERWQRRLAPAGAGGTPASKPDRRAAVLRAWHDAEGWMDADTVSAIAATRYDSMRACLWIDLKDGATLVDSGDSIVLRGRLTWSAALETAAAAERHGWESVEVHGDQDYKDAVAIACMLRNIEVTNHTLSPKVQTVFDSLRAEQAVRSKNPNEPSTSGSDGSEQTSDSPLKRSKTPRSSLDVHRLVTKQRSVEKVPPIDGSLGTEEPFPAYKPRFAVPKKKRSDRSTV